ncbi:MAG: hypothetical protein SCH98_17795 [Deferrisomatales bacterium]|nr:hypothetical protein [Deferrisomatales bacterium]
MGVALALAACGGNEEGRSMDGMEMDAPMTMEQGAPGMDMSDMMQRHAEEADRMAAEMRRHVQEMRGMPADRQHERMADHVP